MLAKEELKNKLIQILSAPATDSNVETVADELATAFYDFVTSGTVIGVCPPGGGALTEGKVT
jgi:hypothetical protein